MSSLCSARQLGPFLNLIKTRETHRDLVPPEFWSADLEDRVPVEAVHGMMQNGVERFGDDQLGLKLGKSMCLGQTGPFDYLIQSSANVRESIEAAGRYSPLLADGYRVWFESWRSHGLIRLFDEDSWPRVVLDLAMSASYKIHVADRPPFTSGVECWFPYATPRDLRAYESAFPGATLKFNAPFSAFAFDRSYERAACPGADPLLHELLRGHLDAIVTNVNQSFGMAVRVRRVIEQRLRQSHEATAPAVARALHLSTRTLSRKLEQEGTSFIAELNNVRRELALTFVREPNRPIAEIAFLLGFSHVESFHRAFKRWTGATPLGFRAARAIASVTSTQPQ
ncbi:MAG TPA: helix-turn-helix domain-containing protein [Polyangiales bacterium]|nr:helix-turn-helix domain-containing protein [Polyangiales bacterium]